MKAQLLGDTLYFHQLLKGKKLKALRTDFEHFPMRSVLDLGVGEGGALVRLYYAFGTSHVEGVESASKETIIRLMGIRRREKGKEPPRCIEDVFSFQWHEQTDIRPVIPSNEMGEFMKNVQFECGAQDYRPQRLSYDVVLCSQMLHYMANTADVNIVLSLMRWLVHPNSLVYLSVKDGIPLNFGAIAPYVLLPLCAEFARSQGLTYYRGKQTETQGCAHIFTNL